jgi:predicted secreted Zn-dependent protease
MVCGILLAIAATVAVLPRIEQQLKPVTSTPTNNTTGTEADQTGGDAHRNADSLWTNAGNDGGDAGNDVGDVADDVGDVDGGSHFFSDNGVGQSTPTSSGSPRLHVDRSKRFYEVKGNSARELWNAIERQAPRHASKVAVGLTDARMRHEATYERRPGGFCKVRRVDIYLSMEVTLPRWKMPTDISADLRRRWHEFTDAVARHERQHEKIQAQAARQLRRVLGGLKAPSCAALRQKVKRRTREIRRKPHARQQSFDKNSRPTRPFLFR